MLFFGALHKEFADVVKTAGQALYGLVVLVEELVDVHLLASACQGKQDAGLHL